MCFSNIICSNLQILDFISKGTFGKVYHAFDTEKNEILAVKFIEINKENELEEINEEIVAHQKLCIENPQAFLKFKGASQYISSNKHKYIVIGMEAALCSLDQILEIRKKYTEEEILYILKDLCSGLISAFKIGIAHCDIKPSNIVLCLDETGSIKYKFCDFGGAIFCDTNNDGSFNYFVDSKKLKAFHQIYAAPEILNFFEIDEKTCELRVNTKFNVFKSEVYSLGVLILRLMGFCQNKIRKIKRFFNSETENLQDLFETLGYPRIYLLIQKILVKKPLKRINIFDLHKIILDFNPSNTPNDAYFIDNNIANITKKISLNDSDNNKKLKKYRQLIVVYSKLGKIDDCLEVVDLCLDILSHIKKKEQNTHNIVKEQLFWMNWKAYLDFKKGEIEKSLKQFQEILNILNLMTGNEIMIASIKINLSFIYELKGETTKSIEQSQQACTSISEYLGEKHKKTLKFREMHALLFYRLGNFGECLAILKEDIILRQSYCLKKEKLAISYQNIAKTYRKIENFSFSRDYYLKSINYWEEIKNESFDQNLAQSYLDISKIYISRNIKNYEKAFGYIEKAISLYQKTDSKKSLAQAIFYKGECELNLKQYNQALKSFETTYNFNLQEYGKDHENTIILLICMARTYKELGEYDKAIELYSKAEQSILASVGNSDQKLIAIFNNLSIIYKIKTDYSKALALAEKASKMYEKYPNMEHETAISYNNLGLLLQELKNFPSAASYFEKSYQIFKGLYGEAHEETLLSLNNFVKHYQKANLLSKALDYALKCLKIAINVYGNDSKKIIEYYTQMGIIYFETNNLGKAKEFHMIALRKNKEMLGFYKKETFASFRFLASIEKKCNNIEAALQHYEMAKKIAIKIFGEKDKKTLEVCFKIQNLKEKIQNI